MLTDIALQKKKYELDIGMVIVYTFHFGVVTNSFVTFHHSWISFTFCTLYYVYRNYVRYGIGDTLIVFVVFFFLIVMNFVYCYEHEVGLRENFNKTQLAKQFRNSLHSVLEVFPEGILIKNGETHHYSNEAIAKKLDVPRNDIRLKCAEILGNCPSHRIETAVIDATFQDLPEEKSLLHYANEGESKLREEKSIDNV